MKTQIYLAVVGVAYVLLAAWCVMDPKQTSQSVGFALKPGSGESEYLAVYGGLQLALGVIFLWPLYRQEATRYCLGVCVSIFAWLVIFRTVGFYLFSDIATTTYILAAIEWLVLLAGLSLWRQAQIGDTSSR